MVAFLPHFIRVFVSSPPNSRFAQGADGHASAFAPPLTNLVPPRARQAVPTNPSPPTTTETTTTTNPAIRSPTFPVRSSFAGCGCGTSGDPRDAKLHLFPPPSFHPFSKTPTYRPLARTTRTAMSLTTRSAQATQPSHRPLLTALTPILPAGPLPMPWLTATMRRPGPAQKRYGYD